MSSKCLRLGLPIEGRHLETSGKGLQIRPGQARMKRMIDDVPPFLDDASDPLGPQP